MKNSSSPGFLAVTDSLGNFADLHTLPSTPLDLDEDHTGQPEKELLPAFGRQGNRHTEPSFSYQAGFAARSPRIDTLNHHAMGSVATQCPNPGSLKVCRF